MLINIKDIDNSTVFSYVVIFIFVIYVFSMLDIKLNIVYGTFIVLLILYAYNEQNLYAKQEIKEILEAKNNSIIPKSDKIKNYSEIVNFLFSIQDFYIYNPIGYEDMVQSLDDFFKFYEEVENNNELAGSHYSVLNDERRHAMNSLQSMIYNFPTNKEYVAKLNNSVNMLHSLLEKYLDNVKLINTKNIYENGYHTRTKIIVDEMVVPYNTFDHTNTFTLY